MNLAGSELSRLIYLISRWPGMYLLLKLLFNNRSEWTSRHISNIYFMQKQPIENPSQLHHRHFRTTSTGKHPEDYYTCSCKTDSSSKSHNTKALTEASMKMLLGTLFLYLYWTALEHIKIFPLKPLLWKHPATAPSTCLHFAQEVLVLSSHKNPSKLKHAGTSQTLIHTHSSKTPW